MLFTDLLKDDLVAAARFYKVEVEPNWNKERIATALLDAGKTPEQWERDRDANDLGEDSGAITLSDLPGPAPVEESSDDDTTDPEDEGEPENEDEPEGESEEKDEELILVRFTGSNQSYTTAGFTFSRFRPFALMTKNQFDTLDRKRFRLASKAEAAEFYRR